MPQLRRQQIAPTLKEVLSLALLDDAEAQTPLTKNEIKGPDATKAKVLAPLIEGGCGTSVTGGGCSAAIRGGPGDGAA